MAGGAEGAAWAAAETAARASYGKLLALLAARSRDVAAAEDALAEAFAAALVQWPSNGIPQKPEAWLLAVARRRGIDAARRRRSGEEAQPHLALIAEEMEAEMARRDLPDERLSLMFACAHPAIDPAIRAPLILQAVLGLDARAIASAFLVAPATMGQRLVRAKLRIKQAGIPFRVPEREEMRERLDAVLGAIYAAYGEGWGDPAGLDMRRRALAGESIFLGRLVAALMPGEAEALSLLALMLFAEARRAARRTAEGAFVPLAEQDTALWDEAMIREAEALVRQAGRSSTLARFQIEAAIQAVHAERRRSGRTDWAALKTLYQALCTVSASPVVRVNLAAVMAETGEPAAALDLLEAIAGDERLATYQPYWAARAEILARLGSGEAAGAFRRAAGLEHDPAVRRFLEERREAACAAATRH